MKSGQNGFIMRYVLVMPVIYLLPKSKVRLAIIKQCLFFIDSSKVLEKSLNLSKT